MSGRGTCEVLYGLGCEYSPSQGAFHIDTLQKVLEINREAVLEGANHGYVILGLFRTQEQAGDFAKMWEETITQRA